VQPLYLFAQKLLNVKKVMKTTIVKSSEYRANQSSVFAVINGEYFGDMSYPRFHNFPADANYWRTATCADADRHFTVKEVEISVADFEEIRKGEDNACIIRKKYLYSV
jgi:hypothetical protein